MGSPSSRPAPAAPAQVGPPTKVNSSWLRSSIRAIRERGHYERYLALLPAAYHESILSPPLGVWIPADLMVIHYGACDALNLEREAQIEIGAAVTKRVHGSILSIAVSLAKGAGVTPWAILERAQSVWDRIWNGGSIQAVKLGPRDARMDLAQWPCARFTYCRNGINGVLTSLSQLFCQKVYVKDIPARCTSTSLSYRVMWV
jgi:hypothetical protein